MQVNRGLVFWGVALITAGAVALAIQSGAVAGESAREAWRFWPVALIAIGLAVIAARTPFALVATLLAALVVGGLGGSLVSGWPDAIGIGCGGETTDTVTAESSFGATGDVSLDFNCGELNVSTAAGSGWRVDIAYAGREPEIAGGDGSLVVRTRGDGFPGFTAGRHEWDVSLPLEATLDLDIGANAASSSLDLDDADLSSLAIDANAGDLRLRLPGASVADLSIDANAGSVSVEVDASTTLSGTIEMNAGSLELCAPDGASVAITIEDANVTFSHDLDESDLVRSGDTWRSGGDDAADIAIDVDGNAASFSFNPDGGCS
jgi:hypothetical protein